MAGKIIAISKDRYRASAQERRLYGGKTVTEFWVERAGDPGSRRVVRGYGTSPSARKADAIDRSGLSGARGGQLTRAINRSRRRALGAGTGEFRCLNDAEGAGGVGTALIVGGAAIGSVIAARRGFAEPWHAGAGAVAGGGLAYLIAQGVSYYLKSKKV